MNDSSTMTNTDQPDLRVCEDVQRRQEQPLQNLAEQQSQILPFLYQNSLDKALNDSLFSLINPRPLAIYIYDKSKPSTHTFNDSILCSYPIYAYIAKHFLVWPWKLTDDNYYELLTIVSTHAGEEAAAIIDSTSTAVHPLFICLVFDRGQIKVECVIQGIMPSDKVFSLLIQASETFNDRFELPDTSGLRLNNISTENWSIPASTIIEVPKTSDEFQRVAADFDGGAPSIVRIDRIENTVWLIQYLTQKQKIDTRLGHENSEKLLFHGCPYRAVEQILEQGFDHRRIGSHGASYGRGFYFSTSRLISDPYAIKDPVTGEKKMLMCRVLIGRSCKGHSGMTTCPVNYDSTYGEKSVFVVYSNRHVLPEYLITYK